ncbi:hypothetical protein V6N13_001040 [Hibiscus sabdariffa]|uniref:Uncharacterized protein n=1 Tax=Hibiscus sabdariffa TaxID=183260 RepID=A0ABR2G746_9ROSI
MTTTSNHHVADGIAMIPGSHTKQHHHKRTSMAGMKVLEDKTAIVKPACCFEDPKVNPYTNMILHGNKMTGEDQSKRATYLGSPFVSDFSAMEISTPFNRKRVFEHLNDGPDAKRRG